MNIEQAIYKILIFKFSIFDLSKLAKTPHFDPKYP